MSAGAKVALLRDTLSQLLRMCPPESVADWAPTDVQKGVYVSLVARLLDAINDYRTSESEQVVRQGHVQAEVTPTVLAFYRELLPRSKLLERAYEVLDPEGAYCYQVVKSMGVAEVAGGGVKRTIEMGIDQVYELIERNPDRDFGLCPSKANDFLDSKLITFEPDSWLDRACEIAPIRIDQSNLRLPMHVRLRLEEAFRAYTFGCWLSVLVLARAILEYALIDNLSKFGIESAWPADRHGKRRSKRLEELVDEVSRLEPRLRQPMESIRTYGNDYVHPKQSRVSKEQLMQRERDARDAIALISEVTELLYLQRPQV